MEYWFSPMYRAVDAMAMDGFLAGLTEDAEVTFGNHPALKGKAAFGQKLAEVLERGMLLHLRDF